MATLDDLDVVKDYLDDVVVARAHHIITENTRTISAVSALNHSDYTRLGQLMNQSYESLKESYEVNIFFLIIILNNFFYYYIQLLTIINFIFFIGFNSTIEFFNSRNS